MLYSSHISWSSPTTPTPLELYPALAFDRLFKDESSPEDQSVLDAVLADAKDLRRKISLADQQKLDEYLDCVREMSSSASPVPANVANCRVGGRRCGTEPPAPGGWNSAGYRRAYAADVRYPRARFSDRHNARGDAQAEQRPQCAAIPESQQRRAGGARIDYMIHHLSSHTATARIWLKVNQFFMEQLAVPGTDKLDSIQEGDRTLLDNTMLMHCSSMMAGALHNNDQLPVILLGGAGGKLKGAAPSTTPTNPNVNCAVCSSR